MAMKNEDIPEDKGPFEAFQGAIESDKHTASGANPYVWEDEEDEDEEDSSEEDFSADTESDSDDSDSESGEESPSQTDKTPTMPDVATIARAARAGLEPQEIEALSASGALEAIVSTLERRGKADNGNDEPEFELKKLDLGLDAEEWDEGVAETLNRINDAFFEQQKTVYDRLQLVEAELKKERQERDGDRKQREEQRQIEFLEWADTQFQQSDQFADLLGSEPVEKLGQNSPQFQNRVKVIQEFARQKASHPEMPDQKVFNLSLKVVFADQLEKLSAKKIRNKVKEHRESRVSPRPTPKRTSIDKTITEQAGTKSAVQYAKSFLSKFGVSG